jgi:hypothetical protein
MRIRTEQKPPTRNDIDRILREGAHAEESSHRYLLRRLRQSCFLDAQDRPLSSRERLVAQYKNDGLALFLGAGVSIDSGVPSWPKLARNILIASGVAAGDVDNVIRAFPSFSSQFELARQRFGTEKAFINALYGELYRGIECKELLENIPRKYEEQAGWSGWSEILKALERNRTLEAIGKLLMILDGGTSRRNPQVHAVLTANVDTLLELYWWRLQTVSGFDSGRHHHHRSYQNRSARDRPFAKFSRFNWCPSVSRGSNQRPHRSALNGESLQTRQDLVDGFHGRWRAAARIY